MRPSVSHLGIDRLEEGREGQCHLPPINYPAANIQLASPSTNSQPIISHDKHSERKDISPSSHLYLKSEPFCDLTGQSWRPNATDLHLSFLMMMLWFTCIQNIQISEWFLFVCTLFVYFPSYPINIFFLKRPLFRNISYQKSRAPTSSWRPLGFLIGNYVGHHSLCKQTMLGQHTFEVGTFVYFHRNMFEKVERWEKYWRIFYKCEHLYSAPAQASEPAPAVLKMKEISVSKCFQMEPTYNCNLSICAPNAGAMAT